MDIELELLLEKLAILGDVNLYTLNREWHCVFTVGGVSVSSRGPAPEEAVRGALKLMSEEQRKVNRKKKDPPLVTPMQSFSHVRAYLYNPRKLV